MNSSPETSIRTTRTPGAHRADRAHREARDRAAVRTLAQRPSAPYEPYLDGLFTYCLSVLCDHEEATAALGSALVFAERRGQRVPQSAGDRRAWLYALARWSCLRKLAETQQRSQTAHASGRPASGRLASARLGDERLGDERRGAGPRGAERRGPAEGAAPAPPMPKDVQEARRAELARLAWPEAAGTSPEQREALELAVRHHLAGHEVAAVLGRDLAATRELLASAACEVERTRAALAVVESGGCPGVSALTDDSEVVLSAALRRELVRHVDDCPRCRRAAERAIPGRWPGSSVTPAELPVLPAPRADVRAAMAHHPRARGAAPRLDRRGFPMDPKDRAARRDRLRARAVTTTVVATVVAAPVLAVWAAYRGTPTGEGHDGPSASAREHDHDALTGGAAGGYQSAGNARPGPDSRADGAHPDVSVQVVSVSGAGRQDGRLTVTAAGSGDTTLVTLKASGPSPVQWSASTRAPWLYLSRSSGTLAPGQSVTVKVYVDPLREPSGHWTAQVAVAPAGAVVTIDGYGTAPSAPAPALSHPAGPSPTRDPGPRPTATGGSSGSPTGEPSPSSGSPGSSGSSEPSGTPASPSPSEPSPSNPSGQESGGDPGPSGH
ncbi:hypothetical protein [Streptomyces sp. NPDC046985]|uniref:BACON domain-containing protein n=1 Tax=Streptomyces sp. NPDC046985 TaxID=3155377 RepID=UPI00340789E8